MELEGVFGPVVMLHELVRSMRMFVEPYGTSLTSRKNFFPSKYAAEGYELFDIPLESDVMEPVSQNPLGGSYQVANAPRFTKKVVKDAQKVS